MMTEHTDLIEQTKIRLVEGLGEIFDPITVPDLSWVAEGLEGFLRQQVTMALLENLNAVVPGARLLMHSGSIVLGDRQYRFGIGDDIHRPDMLPVAFVQLNVGKSPRKPKGADIRLKGCGQYRLARLYVPSELTIDQDLLLRLIQAIFVTGYAWLEQKTLSLARTASEGLVEALYGIVRPLIPDEDLLRDFCFSTISEERGFYLLDQDSVACTLGVMAKGDCSPDYSPIRLVAELLSNSLSFPEMHARFAIQKQDCYDADLRASEYEEHQDLFVKAELATYTSESFSLYPIVYTGSVFLMASFRTKNKAAILPMLRAQREKLASAFESSRSHIRRLLKGVYATRSRFEYGKLGELLGGFTKGVFGI